MCKQISMSGARCTWWRLEANCVNCKLERCWGLHVAATPHFIDGAGSWCISTNSWALVYTCTLRWTLEWTVCINLRGVKLYLHVAPTLHCIGDVDRCCVFQAKHVVCALYIRRAIELWADNSRGLTRYLSTLNSLCNLEVYSICRPAAVFEAVSGDIQTFSYQSLHKQKINTRQRKTHNT